MVTILQQQLIQHHQCILGIHHYPRSTLQLLLLHLHYIQLIKKSIWNPWSIETLLQNVPETSVMNPTVKLVRLPTMEMTHGMYHMGPIISQPPEIVHLCPHTVSLCQMSQISTISVNQVVLEKHTVITAKPQWIICTQELLIMITNMITLIIISMYHKPHLMSRKKPDGN
ncbi:unnamed protein product [Meganyctiphanes norvegica]|uniref:NADH dehydrogenase subunit 6 n=1 Tax=Meganyctiphanes norvegica TaxID=48144 RepID=A0AAV2QLF6_MEGNR